jgi:hypothetical protein
MVIDDDDFTLQGIMILRTLSTMPLGLIPGLLP